MQRIAATFTLMVLGLGSPTRPAAPPPEPWLRPVPGALVTPFRAPSAPWAPGHRGADLAAAPGTPVRAAGAGVVTFAGTVANTLHVVVRHPNGLRTGYSFLADTTVHAGMLVARGSLLGHTGGPADAAHGSPGLHFSLRSGSTYRDPMVLFEPIDLGAVVHLAAIGDP